MEIKKQDIGVWVKASEELPTKLLENYYCKVWSTVFNKSFQYTVLITLDGEWQTSNVTHWQKMVEQVYILTEEQLNERDNKMYRKGQESVSVTDFNRE